MHQCIFSILNDYVKPMTKENLEEFAYKSIIKLILENHYRPGDFLLETQLAKRLNLSRTPVNNALSKLVAQGILDKKKKKGCYIPLPTPEDAKEVFYARENIEYLTTASAALHATDAEIEDLHALIRNEKEIRNADNKEVFATINEQLHLGIARMCKNKYLEQYCNHVFWRSNIYIFFFDAYFTGTEKISGESSLQMHIKIVDAIEKRCGDEAGSLMKQHIDHTFKNLILR